MFTGKDIITKREAEKLSAIQLAEKLQVNVHNLYKWQKGKKPQDPEDYRKVENWLSSKIESVPVITVNKIEQLAPQSSTDKLLDAMNELLRKQNFLLEGKIESLEKKIVGVQSNLNDALGRVESLKFDIVSAREVVLKSLARIEEETDDSVLLKQADNRIEELRAEQSELYTRAERDK